MWTPKVGDKYYSVNLMYDSPVLLHCWSTSYAHPVTKLGNCFKTIEEAELMLVSIRRVLQNHYVPIVENIKVVYVVDPWGRGIDVIDTPKYLMDIYSNSQNAFRTVEEALKVLDVIQEILGKNLKRKNGG